MSEAMSIEAAKILLALLATNRSWFVPSFMKRLRGIPGRVQSSSRRPSGRDLTPVAKITATKA